MLICHISDLHIRAPGELAYRRVDTARHLQQCVAHILAQPQQPDVLVITGDLVDLGRPEEYRHLARLLEPISIPTYVIPGNHDDRQALRRSLSCTTYFPSEGEFLHYAFECGPLRFIALDTVIPGEGGGTLCAERLAWLAHALERNRASPTIILMHRPPFETGIEHMDRLGLTTAWPLEPLIAQHPNVERILCGHLHRTIFHRFGGTIAVTCPSPAHQVTLDLSPDAPSTFTMEPPGYLLHRWSAGAGLVSLKTVIGEFAGPYPFYDGDRLIT